MPSKERCLFLINALQEAANNKLLNAESSYLLEACALTEYTLIDPYPPQWEDYCLLTKSGGIIPFYLPLFT